jgi:hypothetical protein
MATPINAPMAGEIWHLSIEDLFQQVTEAPRLGGDGPFVINLSVSTAPISIPTKAFDGCRDAHVYQIQVTEDGRTRYRLRLGPFVNEDQADAVLAEVRETYPGALTATAGAPDLRVIASMQPKAESKQPDLQRPVPSSDPNPVVAENTESAAKTRAAKLRPAEAEADISIDIAWPTPELVVPPLRAAPGVTVSVAPRIESKPAAAPPVDLPPEWALPDLDVPVPKAAVVGPVANAAPVLTEVVAPAPKVPPKAAAPMPAPQAAAPAITPVPTAVDAPVLTEAVVPKPKPAAVATQTAASAPKTPAPATPSPRAPIVAAPLVRPAAPIVAPRTAAPVNAASRAPAVVARASALRAAVPISKPAKGSIFAQAIASALKPPAPRRQPDLKPPASGVASLRPVVVATAPAPPPREVKKLDQPLESLEHTQTVRALTAKELEDIESSRWFVIQLALADRAFDPDAVPNLDIFDEYRLYSVAGLDQGRVVHALRLGFFREEIGAVAVASYLAAYWDKPTIKRVSVAERERFANQKVEARKDVGASGTHAIIEITDELVAPRKRTLTPAAPAKSSNQPVGH